MANVYAVKSGNWSDVTVWNTGALPTSADDVYSNTFTVTVDVSPTVLSIRNTSATGISAGGTFTLTSGVNLTATSPTGAISSSGQLISLSLGASGSCTLTANISINSNSNPCLPIPSQGTTLNIVGSLFYAGNGYCWIFNNAGSAFGTLNFTGTILPNGGIGGGGDVFYINCTSGTININGTINGGSSTAGGSHGLKVVGSGGTYTITGQAIGGSATPAFSNLSSGVISFTGTATGGSGSGNAFINSSTGTITHIGTAQASATAAAIGPGAVGQNTRLTGPLLCTDASFTGASASGVNPCVALRWFPLDTALTTFQYRMRGQSVSGSDRPARDMYFTDAYAATYPATGNVRSGTTYGPGGINTGTLAVPPAGSVALGVPVDATTGTAVLTQANFQAALDAQGLTSARAAKLDNLDAAVSSRLATSGYTAPPTPTQNATAVRTELSPELARIDTTVSSRLAGASYQSPLDASGTRAAIGLASANLDTQLSPLPNLDTTVSSRLASSSYAAPLDASGTRTALGLASANLDSQLNALPTAAENASAVRTELTPELNNLDAAVSTRSTFNPAADTVANVTLVDTTTNLTNPPVVPTTTEIADAVRVELTPELNHLDADVSSRLASVDYTIPPTPEQNAQAVEVQLALPLGNLDVAVSTRSTFNPATDVVANVTLVDTTTDLTNPPVVPTPEQIAEAVRTELNPELDRVSNCATVATTGQQIQNALSL